MPEEAGADGRASDPTGGIVPTPWERDDARFPTDMFRSWLQCMTEPHRFFRSVDPSVPFSRPLLFFFVFWILGSGLGTLSADAALGDWYAARGVDMPGATWNLFLFFLSPFLGAMSLALYIGFTHLGVRVFVKNPRTIGVTARGLCYVAAPQLLAVVPFVGWMVAAVWSLFLAVVSVQRLHRTSAGSAVAAVLVPPIVFSMGMGMLVFFLVFFVTLVLGGAT
ncbi:MAG: YIP1 family protein [Gemmatimonadota bacterium]